MVIACQTRFGVWNKRSPSVVYKKSSIGDLPSRPREKKRPALSPSSVQPPSKIAATMTGFVDFPVRFLESPSVILLLKNRFYMLAGSQTMFMTKASSIMIESTRSMRSS